MTFLNPARKKLFNISSVKSEPTPKKTLQLSTLLQSVRHGEVPIMDQDTQSPEPKEEAPKGASLALVNATSDRKRQIIHMDDAPQPVAVHDTE